MKLNAAQSCCFANVPTTVFPGARVRFLKFEGNEEGTGARFNVIKDIWSDGPLPLLISEVEQIVEAQMRNFTRLGKDGRFYSRPEYPREA